MMNTNSKLSWCHTMNKSRNNNEIYKLTQQNGDVVGMSVSARMKLESST